MNLIADGNNRFDVDSLNAIVRNVEVDDDFYRALATYDDETLNRIADNIAYHRQFDQLGSITADDLFVANRFGCSLNSFAADTLVTVPGGFVSIVSIEAGAAVIAYNEAIDDVGLYEVTAQWSHLDDELTTLIIDGELIETTPWHDFYTDEGWQDAGELVTGDLVLSLDGDYGVVDSVRTIDATQWMYDLTVADAHTFAVGTGQWVVHNCKVLAAPFKYGDGISAYALRFRRDLLKEGEALSVATQGNIAVFDISNLPMQYHNLDLTAGVNRMRVYDDRFLVVRSTSSVRDASGHAETAGINIINTIKATDSEVYVDAVYTELRTCNNCYRRLNKSIPYNTPVYFTWAYDEAGKAEKTEFIKDLIK